MTAYDERTPDCATNTQYKVMLSGYKWALSRIPGAAGKEILDCACGRGYGTFYMAAYAKKVLGVDVSREAVAHCRGAYSRDNLVFEVMDALDLKLPPASFDAVVSQDTIEHVADDKKFLAGISRVLKKDGVFVVFTPLSPVHNEKPDNIYHLREYSAASFHQLLGLYFKEIKYYGKRLSPELAKLENGLSGIRALDPLGLRRFIPVRLRHMAGSLVARCKGLKPLAEVTEDDVEYFEGLDGSPTIIAVCKKA